MGDFCDPNEVVGIRAQRQIHLHQIQQHKIVAASLHCIFENDCIQTYEQKQLHQMKSNKLRNMVINECAPHSLVLLL
jgi:hypothetical protein